jgi:Ca2+-binding EF-hand superfamily protein
LPPNSFTKDSTVPLAPSVSEDQVGGTVPASLHVHAEHHHKDVEGSMAKDPGVRKDEELPSTATVSKSERTNEHSSMPKSQTKDYSEPDKRDMITTYSRMSDSELNLTSFTVENQATIYNYFIMYDYDGSGCVSMNELISLFNAMDRLPKEQAFLDHIMSSVDANADGELKFDEFMPFLQAFYSTVYKQAFMDHCVTKESVAKLPKKNLRQALHQIQQAGFALRYEEFELVMEKAEAILDEVPLENLAKKSSGAYGFTFEQFHQVLQFFRQLEFDQLRQSAGFNPERIAEVEALFYEADTDNSGCLDIGEVFQSFQGAQLPITDVDNFVDLFARMDIDKSASLSLPELLRLMSIYSKILAEKGQSSSPKSIRPHHATRCLDQSRVWRLKENAKQLALKVEEVFDRGPSASDMVNIAIIEESEHVLLAKEYGLSVQDMRSLRESFEICDVDGSGTIDKGELKGLLRNLGFPPNTAFQNQVFDSCLANFEKDCNKDDNGLVFQRCVQWILKYFMALAYAAFESFRQGDMIPRITINLALYQLGQYHAKQSFIDFQQEQGLEEKADLDFETFAALVSFLRAQRLEQWRKTYGFSCTELEQYREQFNITCGDSKNSAGKQILELTRIETLLESLGYMHDPRNQGNTMLQAFARVDQEGTGMLTFEDFVRLLRHLENNRTLVKKQEEDQVIKAFGLDSDAVNLLHECFNSCPKSHQGHVSQQDIKIMLSKQKIIKTQDQRKQLSIVLEAVCPREESTVSFANFLRILRSLEQGI